MDRDDYYGMFHDAIRRGSEEGDGQSWVLSVEARRERYQEFTEWMELRGAVREFMEDLTDGFRGVLDAFNGIARVNGWPVHVEFVFTCNWMRQRNPRAALNQSQGGFALVDVVTGESVGGFSLWPAWERTEQFSLNYSPVGYEVIWGSGAEEPLCFPVDPEIGDFPDIETSRLLFYERWVRGLCRRLEGDFPA